MNSSTLALTKEAWKTMALDLVKVFDWTLERVKHLAKIETVGASVLRYVFTWMPDFQIGKLDSPVLFEKPSFLGFILNLGIYRPCLIYTGCPHLDTAVSAFPSWAPLSPVEMVFHLQKATCSSFWPLDQQDDQERTEERLAHIADHLGFSWTGKVHVVCSREKGGQWSTLLLCLFWMIFSLPKDVF